MYAAKIVRMISALPVIQLPSFGTMLK
jgi:hypothetical protein